MTKQASLSDLLKRVSRSFYLSLQLLPPALREPIGLAYLAARLSDTEADGAASAAERELLERKNEVVEAVTNSPDRKAIEDVWDTIRSGQAFDSVRFAGPAPKPLAPEELERYTDLVAGCVGVFWTEICAAKTPGYATMPLAEMCALGRRFGQGLQLVNILRDRHADAEAGRVYVPPDRFPATLKEAREKVAEGFRYAGAVRSRRLRAAVLLPALIANETLDLIEANPQAVGTKIPRLRVFQLLFRTLLWNPR